MITILVLQSPFGKTPQALIPLGFWLFHYLYRTFVFPVLMKPSEKSFPAILVLFALAYNGLNGFNNGEAILANATIESPWEHVHFWVGALIFAAGFAMHFHSDSIIRNLRQPGETGYSIPYGGMFRWVSSPNYLGEIIQWIGWAILTWSLAGVAFALFTFCNLAPRALSNQTWYHKRFPNYPFERKALIPGIF